MHHILTLNSGSSSIKFALFEEGVEPVERLRGQIEGLGAEPRLKAEAGGETIVDKSLSSDEITDQQSALAAVLSFFETRMGDVTIAAVGHRIVHGGPDRTEAEALNERSIAALERYNPLAPLHQPHNLSCVRAAEKAFPDALQVACFDTAFHRKHPWVDDTYALSRDLYDQGVRRYGFHGLSYDYVVDQLYKIAPHHATGRVVVTHLGNGASMCAIRGGQSVGSSMGFTALDGLPMGTRCGQLDPGVVLYLISEKGMTADEVTELLYKGSGLKGLSGHSHDMRQLEAAGTAEAAEAIDYFVFRVRRELGAMTAILSGLDALVFCGGIGENSARTRERICQGFEWVGLELDEIRNRANEDIISADRSRVRVFIIPTNEELMIARSTMRLHEAQRRATAAA